MRLIHREVLQREALDPEVVAQRVDRARADDAANPSVGGGPVDVEGARVIGVEDGLAGAEPGLGMAARWTTASIPAYTVGETVEVDDIALEIGSPGISRFAVRPITVTS
jgi:hypothetical protein